ASIDQTSCGCQRATVANHDHRQCDVPHTRWKFAASLALGDRRVKMAVWATERGSPTCWRRGAIAPRRKQPKPTRCALSVSRARSKSYRTRKARGDSTNLSKSHNDGASPTSKSLTTTLVALRAALSRAPEISREPACHGLVGEGAIFKNCAR